MKLIISILLTSVLVFAQQSPEDKERMEKHAEGIGLVMTKSLGRTVVVNTNPSQADLERFHGKWSVTYDIEGFKKALDEGKDFYGDGDIEHVLSPGPDIHFGPNICKSGTGSLGTETEDCTARIEGGGLMFTEKPNRALKDHAMSPGLSEKDKETVRKAMRAFEPRRKFVMVTNVGFMVPSREHVAAFYAKWEPPEVRVPKIKSDLEKMLKVKIIEGINEEWMQYLKGKWVMEKEKSLKKFGMDDFEIISQGKNKLALKGYSGSPMPIENKGSVIRAKALGYSQSVLYFLVTEDGYLINNDGNFYKRIE